MPALEEHRLSRGSTRLNKLLPRPGNKRGPELAVKTNFAQDGRGMPQQVFPPTMDVSKDRSNTMTLNDVTNLPKSGGRPPPIAKDSSNAYVRPGPNRSVKNECAQPNRNSEVAVPSHEPPPPYRAQDRVAAASPRVPFVLRPAPPSKRNNVLNRLLPQKASMDVSPSDAKIEIGIQVSPGGARYRKDSLQSESSQPQAYAWRRSSNKSGGELNTPTIVVTPVNEEFEARFDGLSTQSSRQHTVRPRSSVYSRYTNGLSKAYHFDCPPPVPPLPNFALDGHRAAQITKASDTASMQSRGISAAPLVLRHIDEDSPWISSVSGEEVDDTNDLETLSKSDRFSRGTSRSSQGWWNFVTSPFSPKSASRSLRQPSSPLPADDRHLSRLSSAKISGRSLFDDISSQDHGELRSAPATERSEQSFGTRQPRTPMRSDTAPGALDLGNRHAVNIYSTPSHGSASSYYERTRNYPSLTGPIPDLNSDRGLELGWSPSQSVYRGSTSLSSQNLGAGDKGLSDMPIPTTGEAAPYYDANRQFSPLEQPRSAVTGSDGIVRASSGHAGLVDYPLSVSAQSFIESPGSATTYEDSQRLASLGSHMILDEGLYPIHSDDRGQTAMSRGYGSDSVPPIDGSSGVGYKNSPIPQEVPRGVINPVESSWSGDQMQQYESRASSDSDSSSAFGRHLDEKESRTTGDESYGPRSRGQVPGDVEEGGHSGIPWYRRLLGLFVVFTALLLLALVVLLAAFVPVHHSETAVQAQWLNLTGFPPLPTGLATVVGARNVKEVNGCVDREALWSCAVPPAEGLSTMQPGQPNFRFLIRFRNGTITNETLVEPTNSTVVKRDSGRAANAGTIARRSAWSNFLFTSSPSPPSIEDYQFLGQHTDDNSLPYAGELTPFYISLLDPIALQPVKRSLLQKREPKFHYPYPTASDFKSHSPTPGNPSSGSSSNASGNAMERVPSPALQTNGEPAASELYPFAYAQPLRLFNRGQKDEHYGFYSYFDRSIFLASFANGTFASEAASNVKMSSSVGLGRAQSVCTFSQSRFLVQIWTGKPYVTDLAASANPSILAVNSTANDLKSPGSFPYAVSFTLDRHGGDASKKGVYCYDIDENNHIIQESSTWIAENRAFGGSIIRPADIPTNNGTMVPSEKSGNGDGIDGGTGGCQCQWQNFR